MGKWADAAITQGGIIAIAAVLFVVASVLTKVLAPAVDRDRLRGEMRIAAAEKRARLMFRAILFEIINKNQRPTLRMPMKNLGLSAATDVWVRYFVETAGSRRLPAPDPWFPLIKASEEETIEVDLGPRQPTDPVRIVLELSYRDFGEIVRREWYGYTSEAGQPGTWVTFRVDTIRRLFRFRFLRAWRL